MYYYDNWTVNLALSLILRLRQNPGYESLNHKHIECQDVAGADSDQDRSEVDSQAIRAQENQRQDQSK